MSQNGEDGLTQSGVMKERTYKLMCWNIGGTQSD